jgi:uncharacterized repeat protein (TIGR01451 family)
MLGANKIKNMSAIATRRQRSNALFLHGQLDVQATASNAAASAVRESRTRRRAAQAAASAIFGACLLSVPAVGVAADIAATAGSLVHHVWSRYNPPPTTALNDTNGALIASGVFGQDSSGTVLPVALAPAFTVTKVSGTSTGIVNSIATYTPGSGPVPGTGYPTSPTHQHEVGSSATNISVQMRYQFASALPPGAIVWLQDVDFEETVSVQFANCAGALVNPSGFDALLMSGNLPARSFSATDVTLAGVSTDVPEPLLGIVIRGGDVCRVDVSVTTTTTSTTQTYFSIPTPRITLIKALQSAGRAAATDQFTMQIRNGGGAIANGTASSTTSGTGATVTAGSGTTGVTAVALNEPSTLIEAPAGSTSLARYTSAIACSNANAGSGTALPAGAGQSFSLTPTNPLDDILCTLTNTRLPSLVLRKALPTGRGLPADQFALGINGPVSASATTTGATNAPAQTATVNATSAVASYTLRELGAGATNLSQYTSTYACSNTAPGGQTPSGNGTSFSVTTAVGDALDCSFTNTPNPRADLSIVKTASPASVMAGGLVTFTLNIANAGPSAANGAVVRDNPGAGLDCTAAGLAAPTCSASGPATCPASITAAALAGAAGVSIPTLGAGGALSVTLQCRATADGKP